MFTTPLVNQVFFRPFTSWPTVTRACLPWVATIWGLKRTLKSVLVSCADRMS